MRLSIHSTRRSAAHDPRPAPSSPARTRRRARRRNRRTELAVIITVAVLGLICTASSAHAETIQIVALAATVDQVLTNIRNWLMGILAGLATMFVTLGGVRYLLAGGDPGEVEKAKSAFRSAGIGYGLAALAPLVVAILQGIVGA